MPLLDQCNTPWESSRAGSDPCFLVPLPLQHPPDQSCVSQRVLLTMGQTCQARQGVGASGTYHTSHFAQQPLVLLSCLCPQILLVLPRFFHFLHHPLFPSQVSPCPHLTESVSSWACLDGAKHFSVKMPSAVGLCVLQERKSMWLRQEICCLAFAPTCCVTPGQPHLCSLPDRPCRYDKPSLCREGSLCIPTVWGRAEGCQAELVAIQQRLLSPSSQPDPWAAHLEPPPISRGSLCVQCK